MSEDEGSSGWSDDDALSIDAEIASGRPVDSGDDEEEELGAVTAKKAASPKPKKKGSPTPAKKKKTSPATKPAKGGEKPAKKVKVQEPEEDDIEDDDDGWKSASNAIALYDTKLAAIGETRMDEDEAVQDKDLKQRMYDAGYPKNSVNNVKIAWSKVFEKGHKLHDKYDHAAFIINKGELKMKDEAKAAKKREKLELDLSLLTEEEKKELTDGYEKARKYYLKAIADNAEDTKAWKNDPKNADLVREQHESKASTKAMKGAAKKEKGTRAKKGGAAKAQPEIPGNVTPKVASLFKNSLAMQAELDEDFVKYQEQQQAAFQAFRRASFTKINRFQQSICDQEGEM
jgi:hypothetical protein